MALSQRWKKNLSELLDQPQGLQIANKVTLVRELTDILERYLDAASIENIVDATLYSANAHKGQKRQSGEDYIYHPIAVARILGEMRMDSRTIIAAILHDVVEDTDITLEQLIQRFGADVASLVDGVSKVSQLEQDQSPVSEHNTGEHRSEGQGELPPGKRVRTRVQESREQAEVASFRKMFMAMAKDIRVIIIKLADRLHNMSTLESLDQPRRRRIARQTLDIYAPMANRLGMRELVQKLEDLSLKNLYPKRYDAIEKRIKTSKRGRKPVVDEVCRNIEEKLKLSGISAEVNGREKNVFNIYRKMQRKKLMLRDVKDINAIRVITAKRALCYQALGVIHQLYKPVPTRFKDYIAIPKVNGYQSLHTLVVGPYGQPVEVQIRSQSMHRAAEQGVASHWIYKTETTGEHAPQQLAQQWLNSFLEAPHTPQDSGEYLEHLKADLFPDEVYVFTPKGSIKRLPRGATALDFAYAVHSGVGDRCIGATVNDITVPLHATLSNGDRVEIKTGRLARPAPSSLDYAVTSKARASIRHHLSQQKDKESLKIGRKLLNTALTTQGYRRIRIPSKHKIALLQSLDLEHWETLLTDLGSGKRLPTLVAQQLISASSTRLGSPDMKPVNLTIEGTERLMVAYPNCCHPIPGDKIIGTITVGRGLVVHRANCSNINNKHNIPENYLHLNWASNTSGRFQVELHVVTANQPGVLATISNIIACHHSNINHVNVNHYHQDSSDMTFIIAVSDRNHLAKIIRQIRVESTVVKVTRK